jgi:acyl-CoA thioester hydrolase
MGVVYHGNYFNWFEMGRTEYCRNLGKTYLECEHEGIFLPVVEAHCRHKRSVFYDDEITIWTWIEKISSASVTFGNRIERDNEPGKVVAEGWTKHAFVDKNGKIIRGKNELAELMEKQMHTKILLEDEKRNGEKNTLTW